MNNDDYLKETYVSWESAKRLRENGYDVLREPNWFMAYDDTKWEDGIPEDTIVIDEYQYPLITQERAMKWLRNAHKLYVYPCWSDTFNSYSVLVKDMNIDSYHEWASFICKTHEQACEEGIEHALCRLEERKDHSKIGKETPISEWVAEVRVTNETAKLLKKAGFQQPCTVSFYDEEEAKAYIDKKKENHLPFDSDELKLFSYPLPTQQMALKWLREKYGIVIEAPIGIHLSGVVEDHIMYRKERPRYQWSVRKIENDSLYFVGSSDSIFEKKEQAYEDALLLCLKNI